MDTKRHHSIANFKNLVTLYRDKYKNTKFDAIIVSDNNAFSFFKFNREELFKNTPAIFCGINYLVKNDLDGLKDVTGINEKPDILKNFKLIKKLHPKNRDVYIVIDTTTTGNITHRELKKLLEKMPKDEVNYHILRGYSLEELSRYLEDKNGVLLLTVFFKDSKQKSYEHYELVEKLDESINLPLYGLWDFNFGNGLLGGYLTSGFFQGKEAALMAKRVLDGEYIDNIEVLYESPNSYMFDYKQMKKHGLHVEDLPKNHFLINYKKTFYEENKREIYLALGVVFLLSVIIMVLLINIQKRKKAEKKLQESEKPLELKVESRTEELKSTIDILKKAQDQLVYSEKMSALEGLVAGVSHEINTPVGLGLTGITHFLDITKVINNHYKNDDLSQEEFETYLRDSLVLAEVIFSNLQKSAELVRSFKQISVDQTSEAQRSFNLKEYTSEILVSLTNITKNRKVIFCLDCEDVSIYSYPGAYSQIMTNLFVNTLNHAFEKEQSGEVSVDVKKLDNKVFISFKDNGKGIKKDDLDKIFNPFFTTNRKFGGSGLGLNIVYNIIKTTFNGEIICKSTIGTGTQFDIELKI
jgi:signal transduction histidine kinase